MSGMTSEPSHPQQALSTSDDFWNPRSAARVDDDDGPAGTATTRDRRDGLPEDIRTDTALELHSLPTATRRPASARRTWLRRAMSTWHPFFY